MKQSPRTTGWTSFSTFGLSGQTRVRPSKQKPVMLSGKVPSPSISRLKAKLHTEAIDRANARKGGSTRIESPLQRVKTCKCISPVNCPHKPELPSLVPIQTPKVAVRNTGYVGDRDTHDPRTNLRYPTAYVALCPRCELLNCNCGRDAEVKARLGGLGVKNDPHLSILASKALGEI